MKKQFDKETGKTAWILDKLWQKVIYIAGWVYLIFFIAEFLKGFWEAL